MRCFIPFISMKSAISDVFDNFRESPLPNILSFVFGVIVGFIICILIYFVVVINSLKKSEKIASNVVLDVEDEIIYSLINNAKNKYIAESAPFSSKVKIESLKEICSELLNDIASCYYPKSKYPVYELSIEEFLKLANYISERIESLFSGRILKKVKKLKISKILYFIDLQKKYRENKVTKAATKASKFWSYLNIINPAYWIKKIAIDKTFNAILNKISLTIIDVVGEEASKVYSKSLFVESNPEKSIEEEIEGIVKGEINE